MMFLVYLFLLGIKTVKGDDRDCSSTVGKCGPQWVQRGNKCYYFSFERVTWRRAAAICRGMRANLVAIEDEEEDTFLANQVLQERVCYRQAVNYRGTFSTTRSGIMCQRWDSQSPHSHDNTENWKYPEGNLSEASNYCRDPNRDLLPNTPWCYTVSDVKRFEECTVPKCAETAETETTLWIGLNDLYDEGVWKWSHDNVLYDGSYSNWAEQQPDNYEGNEHCGVMWFDRGGKWNDGPCSSQFGFICETPELI